MTTPEQKDNPVSIQPTPRKPNHPLRPVNVDAHLAGREHASDNGAHNLSAEERAAGIDGR